MIDMIARAIKWAVANDRPSLFNKVPVAYERHNSLPSNLPRVPTMAPTSQRSKKHNNLLPRLDVAIQLLSNAKDICGVAPAQIALGSACVLLTAIRVRSLLLSDELPGDVYSGHRGQQTRVCRPWTVLR